MRIADSDMESRTLLQNPNTRTPPMDKLETPFKREIVWKNAIVYFISHAFSIYLIYVYIFVISWQHFVYAFAMGVLVSQGILMGAHRHYSHRSFKASKPLQIAMIMLQTASSQNCLWVWVRDHRQHHKYTDTDADPHNARNGFFFSHVGWLLTRKHPDVLEKGKTVDMSDLDADPYVMFQKRHYKKLWLLCAIVLPVLFPIFVLGEHWLTAVFICDILRIVITLNCTWMVNSWAHLYGTKPFDKNMMPVESYLVGVVSIGEGWHNYHHCFPWDYKASEFGVPFNLTTKVIRLCERVGLAWDLKEATPAMVVSRATRTGDGTPIRTTTTTTLLKNNKDDNNSNKNENNNNDNKRNNNINKFKQM